MIALRECYIITEEEIAHISSIITKARTAKPTGLLAFIQMLSAEEVKVLDKIRGVKRRLTGA